jgi:hypothetical protein
MTAAAGAAAARRQGDEALLRRLGRVYVLLAELGRRARQTQPTAGFALSGFPAGELGGTPADGEARLGADDGE